MLIGKTTTKTSKHCDPPGSVFQIPILGNKALMELEVTRSIAPRRLRLFRDQRAKWATRAFMAS